MFWFGKSWGAPVCLVTKQISVPIGQVCIECEIPIAAEDSGFAVPFLQREDWGFTEIYYHRDCFLEDIGIDASETARLFIEEKTNGTGEDSKR